MWNFRPTNIKYVIFLEGAKVYIENTLVKYVYNVHQSFMVEIIYEDVWN